MSEPMKMTHGGGGQRNPALFERCQKRFTRGVRLAELLDAGRRHHASVGPVAGGLT
jgi:hypothetical protein